MKSSCVSEFATISHPLLMKLQEAFLILRCLWMPEVAVLLHMQKNNELWISTSGDFLNSEGLKRTQTNPFCWICFPGRLWPISRYYESSSMSELIIHTEEGVFTVIGISMHAWPWLLSWGHVHRIPLCCGCPWHLESLGSTTTDWSVMCIYFCNAQPCLLACITSTGWPWEKKKTRGKKWQQASFLPNG